MTAPEPAWSLKRLLLMLGGFLAVGLGGIGLIVPGLPGTVFFIIAAWFFSLSSPRFEQWVLELPGVGPMVADHRAGLGMPRRAKRAAITSIVVFAGLSALFGIDNTMIRLAVVAAGAVGVWYVGWRVPTKPEPNPPAAVEVTGPSEAPR